MGADKIILVVCLLVYTLAAAIVDWRFKRIPNVLTVSAFAAGMLFNGVKGALAGGFTGAALEVWYSLLGFAVGFGLLFVLWLIGGGGGGDVKYMGALGAWLQPTATLYVIVLGSAVTVVVSVIALIAEAMRLGFSRARSRYLTTAKVKTKGSFEAIETSRQQGAVRKRLMPWAVPAGLATWIVLAWMVLRSAG